MNETNEKKKKKRSTKSALKWDSNCESNGAIEKWKKKHEMNVKPLNECCMKIIICSGAYVLVFGAVS